MIKNKNELQKVLFVCMGNICRSPAGEGILKEMVRRDPLLNIHVESCGIGDWHVGQPPDHRMQATIKERGIFLTSRAKKFESDFFDQFDYILAADQEVLKCLHHFAQTTKQKAKISLMTAYSNIYKGQEVPDPYCQPNGAFDLVLDILEDSCHGLVEHIRHQKDPF